MTGGVCIMLSLGGLKEVDKEGGGDSSGRLHQKSKPRGVGKSDAAPCWHYDTTPSRSLGRVLPPQLSLPSMMFMIIFSRCRLIKEGTQRLASALTGSVAYS